MTTARPLLDIHQGRPTSDGAGVRLLRVFGGAAAERFDPFLMLDEFGSENPDDYVAGFPPHPHRGFETITCMLVGRMRHQDHLGNVGLLADGGVQWMTAARGIIHSEMPEQQDGVMRGLQIWLNLPAANKLDDPAYRDFAPEEIPRLERADGSRVRVVAGVYDDGEHQVRGPVQRPGSEAQLFQIDLAPGAELAPRLEDGMRVLVYLLDGELELPGSSAQPLRAGQLARLGDQGSLSLRSAGGARLMLLAGRPLREPIVQYGPFVMNTREEIDQALRDYRDGTLAG